MVQSQRKINKSTAKMTMFWGGAKGHCRQHQGLNGILLCCLFCGSHHQRLSKPGVKINGEMRTLLFGTTGRDDREPTEIALPHENLPLSVPLHLSLPGFQ